MKIFNKSLLKRRRHWDEDAGRFADGFDDVLREVALMKKLRHRNLVGLHEVIDSPEKDKLYLILDYVPGGPVMGSARRQPPLGEEAARRVGFHQVRRPASAEPSSIEGAVVTHPRTQIADAIKVRAEELGVALPERAFWDEPDKRFYVKEPEAAPAAEESDDEEDME